MGSSPTSGTIKYGSKLLAYIIGVAVGDGNLSNPNGRAQRLRISCDPKYPKLLEEIKTSMALLMPKNRVSVVIRKDNCIDISCYSNKWESLLGWKCNGGSKFKQEVRIPKWILESGINTKECLRGLIQTDGSIYLDRNYTMINFTTIIPGLASDVIQMIKQLGFAPKLYKKTPLNRNSIFVVRISKNTISFTKAIKLYKK